MADISSDVNQLVKVRFLLPEGHFSGGSAEWMWARKLEGETYELDNIPMFVYGVSSGDHFIASKSEDLLEYLKIAKHMGHSTYRMYVASTARTEDIAVLLRSVADHGCQVERLGTRVIAVDVPAVTDVQAVFHLMEQAEENGFIEFEEGHFGHAQTGC